MPAVLAIPSQPDLGNLFPEWVSDLIRIGRSNDGGYLISERCVADATMLIGLGINDDWSFEEDFLRRNPAVRLIAVDGSVSKRKFLRDALGHAARAALVAIRGSRSEAKADWRQRKTLMASRDAFAAFFSGDNRLFIERMIGDIDGQTGLSWQGIVDEASRTQAPDDRPRWFIKMDIEGAEYRVLPELLRDAHLISGLVVEFHDCDLHAERLNQLIVHLQKRFAVIHVHGNNHAPRISGSECPRVLEITFLNRTLLSEVEISTPNTRTYPIANLDQTNRAGDEDYVFLRRQ